MEFAKVCVVMSAVLKMSSGIFTTEQTTRIETFVEAVMACRRIPGLSLAVVRGNQTWTKGFGVADREEGIKVSTDTLFGIGSTTKAFTATLLGMLIDDSNGRVTWNTKVKDILGEDFAFVDLERTRKTTIRDLLTHRTGLETTTLPMMAGFDHNYTTKEFAKRFRFLPEVHAFRDVFDYNNWGYAVAGHVVEVLSGESWEATLEKRIFRPLGMTKSRVLGKTIQTSDDGVAKPYYIVDNHLVLTDPAIYDIHPLHAAASISSSANDMAKWLHFLLREGETTDSRKLINSDILKETFKTHQSLPEMWTSIIRPQYPVSDINHGYGYGWMTSTYRGFQNINHYGRLTAYVSYLQCYPAQDFGIFSSANGAGFNDMYVGERAIQFLISDILLGEEPWLDVAKACTFPSPYYNQSVPVEDNSDVTNYPVTCVECYVGKYGHYFFGNIEVKVGEVSGVLELQYGNIKGMLNSTDDDFRFKMDIVDMYRLFSHPMNYTHLIDVHFETLREGSYHVLRIASELSFTRGVDFLDADVGLITIKTSGQAETNVDQCKMILVFVFAFIVL